MNQQHPPHMLVDNKNRATASAGEASRQPPGATAEQPRRCPSATGRPPTRQLQIATPDGTHLSAKIAGTDEPAATVIYLHGPDADGSFWTPLVSVLHQSLGPTIAHLTYRQRAHPHIDTPAATATDATLTMSRFVEDLDAVVAASRGPLIVVAHARAVVTLLTWASQARSRLDQVAGFVLFNAGPELPSPRTVDHETDQVSSALTENRQPAPHSQTRALHATSRPHIYRPQREPTGGTTRRTRATSWGCDDVIALTDSAVEVLRSIPTWVVAGATDPIVHADRAQLLAERLWADFSVISAGGHWLPSTDPGPCSSTVLEALEVAYRAQRFGVQS